MFSRVNYLSQISFGFKNTLFFKSRFQEVAVMIGNAVYLPLYMGESFQD